MRITKRTNLAMRVLMFCAVNPERIINKAQIAESCNASENHLGHVINQLGQYGYLETLRGRRGGVRLAKPPAEISIGEVFRRFESEVPVTECFAGDTNTCPLAPACRLRADIGCAVKAFYDHLDGVTLDSLVEDNDGLCTVLEQPAAA
ncbi:MAG: Rrf2 family transcriptional regulator [Rhodobacteraceae bacterium]|nr:Rrf2 family transcriptional regulator [Paracoccaceae bacterium]